MTTPGFEKLSKQDRDALIRELFDYQHGICYIDERPIDLSQPVDVDHIKALDRGGQDNKNNWGLTHATCNRGKGNRDLDLLRYLSRFQRARETHRHQGGDDDTFTVGKALEAHGGAKKSIVGRTEVKPTGDRVFICTFETSEQMITREFPLERDLNNPSIESFTALVPIEYVYHDGSINPRSIVDLDPFIEEFYRGNPQLLPSLAHLQLADQPAHVMLFDGQHKAAAQVFLGNRQLYLRVFVNSDVRLLKTSNFGAHTKLAQIHFPMAIQDKVGHDLYLPAFQEFLNRVPDRSQIEERTFFGELAPEERSEMRSHFQGYLKFRVVASVAELKGSFFDFVETVSSRSKSKPLAYETVRKALFNQLMHLRETNTKLEVALRMRDLERDNLAKLLAVFTEKVLTDKFDLSKGIFKLEERLGSDPSIRAEHLRAYRICRQAPLLVVMGELREAIRQLLSIRSRYPDGRWSNEFRWLWAEMQEEDWRAVSKMLDMVLGHKVWIERDPVHAETLESNKKSSWEEILLTGRLPGASVSVYEPLTSGRLLHSVA